MSSIINGNVADVKKKIKINISITGIVGILLIVANILLAVFANDRTQIAFTVFNAVADIIYCWFVYANCKLYLLPERAKIRLLNEEHTNMQGVVEKVGEGEHYFGFNCIDVTIQNSQVTRKIYFIKDRLEYQIKTGTTLNVSIVNAIAVDWEEV